MRDRRIDGTHVKIRLQDTNSSLDSFDFFLLEVLERVLIDYDFSWGFRNSAVPLPHREAAFKC